MNLSFAEISSYAMSISFAFLCALLGLGMGAYAMFLNYRRQRLWHETARLALEKGQPLPPAELSDEELKYQAPPAGVDAVAWEQNRRAQLARNDMRRGIILIGVGIGLSIFMASVNAAQARYVGAIPACIGLAMLANGFLNRGSSR